MFYQKVTEFINSVRTESELIASVRKEILEELRAYVKTQTDAGKIAKLNFICTHNSRRSHLGQIWGQVMADYAGVPVKTFSGGTEATAFNSNAIKALSEAGFVIESNNATNNPVYKIYYSDAFAPITAFSKRYDDIVNPDKKFCAVMTCSDADEKCPVIAGADLRIPIRYEDPKLFDNTPVEAEKYSERCREIAREMAYVFAKGIST